MSEKKTNRRRPPNSGRKKLPEEDKKKRRSAFISDKDLAEIKKKHGTLAAWVRWALSIMKRSWP